MTTTARSRPSNATSPPAGAASTPATRSSPRRSSTVRRAKKAYLYGQAPGIVEGAEGAPWRGRAGSTLRRWLELDEETFYATFYCASVTRCYPGRTAGGRGDRTPTPAERRLCAPWREEELRLLRPDLILTVGGLAAHAIIGVTTLTECVGKSYLVDDAIVIPLPHPSGASSWLNDTANRARLGKALTHARRELEPVVRQTTAGRSPDRPARRHLDAGDRQPGHFSTG